MAQSDDPPPAKSTAAEPGAAEPGPARKATQKAEKEARLAAALRANLRRRKGKPD
ncbi:MAG: hypothetical protein ACFB2Z_09195 [Maricaulaceae bacterium]